MRILLLLVVVVAGCSPEPTGPLLVRPNALAVSYRDQPTTASAAYTGRVVLLPARDFDLDPDRGVCVWYCSANHHFPPVVVTDLTKLPGPNCWIEGRCDGRTSDDLYREIPSFTFTVRVVNCRSVPAPDIPKTP